MHILVLWNEEKWISEELELLTIFSKRSIWDVWKVLFIYLFSFDLEGLHLNLVLPPTI